MRALVLALVVATVAAPDADARRVIMRPSVSRSCQSAPSWERMTSCLAKFGKMTVLRTQGNAKLVQMSDNNNGWRVPGVYLFVQSGKQWLLGGMIEGDDLYVTAFGKASTSKYTGYRIDVSSARTFEMAIAQITKPVVYRQTLAVFCSGDSSFCAVAQTSCDVYVEGKSLWMFRGTLELVDRVAKIRGDRRAAGDMCGTEEELMLPVRPEPSVQ